MAKTKLKGAKAKGDAYERDLCKYFTDALGLQVHRRCLTTQFIQNPGVGAPDLIGTPYLAVEAKRTETFKPIDFMEQAVRNAPEGEFPIVIHRRSRQTIDDSSVMIRLQDFIKLYEAYLVTKGQIRTKR